MLDPELLEQFQMIFSAIEQTKIELRSEIEQTKTELRAEIQDSETRTKVFIENTVTRRLDSLFDGYKLTHEKQWEMERRAERLKQELDMLKVRMDVLESKVSS